jgi:probable HAF family extracellular repeat protein
MMTGLILMAVAASAAGVARPARAEILYTVKDLGTLPGFLESSGAAVNASGQVTGSSYTEGVGLAFLSGPNGGPLQDLGTLGGTAGSIGFAVNASGQVAGYSDITPGSNTPHAFLSGPNGGPLKDLGTLGGANSYGYCRRIRPGHLEPRIRLPEALQLAQVTAKRPPAGIRRQYQQRRKNQRTWFKAPIPPHFPFSKPISERLIREITFENGYRESNPVGSRGRDVTT